MKTLGAPKFKKHSEDLFYATLREEVNPVIIANEERADRVSLIKLIIYPLLYILSYLFLLKEGDSLLNLYTAYAFMGILITLIVFNIAHDAVHGSLFRNRKLNNISSVTLDFLGGNSYMWRKRHVVYHHTYTNVPDWDVDIKQSGIVKFSSGQKFRSNYRFQHMYMPFLYLFYSMNWILVRDFRDYFSRNSLVRKKTNIPRREYIKLFLFKLFYICYVVVIPILILKQPFYHIVFAILLMHFLSSAITLLVLLPSHLDEAASFPEPDSDLRMEDTWAIHQMKVTNDFGTHNRFLNFIMGGLNHHIAHHLFPNVNHNTLPLITEYIRNRATAMGIPYRCYSLTEVMISHYRLLRKNSLNLDFFEE